MPKIYDDILLTEYLRVLSKYGRLNPDSETPVEDLSVKDVKHPYKPTLIAYKEHKRSGSLIGFYTAVCRLWVKEGSHSDWSEWDGLRIALIDVREDLTEAGHTDLPYPASWV